METAQTIPCLEESVLEHIVGIVMREYNATDLPILKLRQ